MKNMIYKKFSLPFLVLIALLVLPAGVINAQFDGGGFEASGFDGGGFESADFSNGGFEPANFGGFEAADFSGFEAPEPAGFEPADFSGFESAPVIGFEPAPTIVFAPAPIEFAPSFPDLGFPSLGFSPGIPNISLPRLGFNPGIPTFSNAPIGFTPADSTFGNLPLSFSPANPNLAASPLSFSPSVPSLFASPISFSPEAALAVEPPISPIAPVSSPAVAFAQVPPTGVGDDPRLILFFAGILSLGAVLTYAGIRIWKKRKTLKVMIPELWIWKGRFRKSDQLIEEIIQFLAGIIFSLPADEKFRKELLVGLDLLKRALEQDENFSLILDALGDIACVIGDLSDKNILSRDKASDFRKLIAELKLMAGDWFIGLHQGVDTAAT